MKVNIYTSSYDSIKNDKYNNFLVSVSGDRGKRANYVGECFPILAPKKDFWLNWHFRNNPYSIENIEYYVTEYYKQVLSTLNVDEVVERLQNKILLCYEPYDEFCHRDIIAYWIELVLGKEIPEIRVLSIDENHSIQAYYLIKKAESLENYAIEALDDDDSNYSMQLSLLAKEYRENASNIDSEYVRNKKKLEKAI